MEMLNLIPEEPAIQVGVDFGGGDLLVPQHFLDRTKVGA